MDGGAWHISNSIINLLISVQSELRSRANSLSKTGVKHFYVFALARGSCPTAQWTESLSDANKPPTLGSAASLGRCQARWVCALWGDPSRKQPACWLKTERWSLWSPLLTMTPMLTVTWVTSKRGNRLIHTHTPLPTAVSVAGEMCCSWRRLSVNYTLSLRLS